MHLGTVNRKVLPMEPRPFDIDAMAHTARLVMAHFLDQDDPDPADVICTLLGLIFSVQQTFGTEANIH